ncbi:hypothetical protein [Ralstonia insidiosa]|jgi:hypothetical protein|nr:hypothetical protein [Ralstonia insidiosa]MBA9939339.1 hypothetical protein [Ralstonia insidiosa]MBC9968109.1 hypothetical protein [Ralstonia insidiosa]MBX3904328.1 hypothetical protein [Ralstonia insidiosa]
MIGTTTHRAADDQHMIFGRQVGGAAELSDCEGRSESMQENVLLDLACRSALMRVLRAPRGQEHAPQYWALNDSVLTDMRRLGREHQKAGLDARTSSFWILLEHRFSYEEAFERRRRVTPAELTPQSIYDAIEKGNTILWQGWEIEVGGSREVTDDYGCPAWEARIWVESPEKSYAEFSDVCKDTARALYKHIVGHPFEGECTLGDDPPHPAEYLD